MRVLALTAGLLALAACEQQPAGEPVVRTELGEPMSNAAPEIVRGEMPDEPQRSSACTEVTFEDVPLTHCIADPESHRIRAVLADVDGVPHGSLSSFAATVEPERIAFAVTGGTFGDDLRAIGYYVEEGERLSELDRSDGDDNFHMKPNGVFFGNDGTWRVLATDSFFATIRDRPRFGTQSGPMLVIDGKLHPAFENDGPSRTIRNAVGVDAQGRAHFVIAEAPISFGRIARYYRDELKTPQALLLASTNSALWDPATGRLDNGRAGPIIVVETRP